MDIADSITWRKSSYSGGSGSECVEVGGAGRGRVLVRDTKGRDVATLAFTVEEWTMFADALK
ncbi:MAG: DUF397 domain-containing protein [Trebonia sp.]